jgi:hypothetical protein
MTGISMFPTSFDLMNTWKAAQPTDIVVLCETGADLLLRTPGMTVTSFGAQESEPLARLRLSVIAIEEGRPSPLSSDLEDLLTQAASCVGRPSNIEDWANRIASESSALAD